MRIEHEGIAPAGYSENDPRIDSLARRAFVLSVPADMRPHVEELMRGRQ
jgi:hypothetical protein